MNRVKWIGTVEAIKGHLYCKKFYSTDGVSPVIPATDGGNTIPKILVDRQYEGCVTRNIKDSEVMNMEQIRMFEAFAGIGAMSKALKRKGVPTKLVGYSEIDKYASRSFSAVHGVSENLNLGDITKIDEHDKRLKNLDLFTYGFPCQDISIAGKQNGMTLVTRSGLLFDALRIIQYNMPKVCIAENVKNLVSKKFKMGFNAFLTELDFYGYNNYWAVLNGLEYGIPQQRERVFIVSIRKDVDDGIFQFGESWDLDMKLLDVLEPVVDEKYYLSDAMLQYIKNKETKETKEHGFRVELNEPEGVLVNPIRAQGDKPMIKTPVIKNHGELFEREISNCIDANYGKGFDNHGQRTLIQEGYRIRRLTPRECWRLMGFSDEDFDRAQATGMSDTQLYKQAGNSIIVDVLEHGVFKYLYK